MLKRITISLLAMLMLAMLTASAQSGKPDDPVEDPNQTPEPVAELLPVGDVSDIRYIEGRLGIGTISPLSKLDVNGNSTLRGQVNLLNWGNTHFDFGDTHDNYISFGSNGRTVIQSFDGSNYRRIASVTHGGLDVTGDGTFTGSVSCHGLRAWGQVDVINAGGNTHFDYGDTHDNFISFGSGGQTVIQSFDGSNYRRIVSVTHDGLAITGNGTFTGTVTTGSSRELKNEISRLDGEDAVKALMDLVPVQYKYKTNDDELELGFIAEDVPDLVARNDRKSLSAMDFAALSVTVIQELKKENQIQQQQIEDLKALVNELINSK